MRFAKCAIEKVDQGGLITMSIAEPVVTHLDFEKVFEDKRAVGTSRQARHWHENLAVLRNLTSSNC